MVAIPIFLLVYLMPFELWIDDMSVISVWVRKKDMHPRTRKVMYSLGLRSMFSAVLVKPSEGVMAKLQRVEPYVTYGYDINLCS